MCEIRKELDHSFNVMNVEQVKEVIFDITHCETEDPEDTSIILNSDNVGDDDNLDGAMEVVLDEVHNKIIINDVEGNDEVSDEAIDEFVEELTEKLDNYVRENKLLD